MGTQKLVLGVDGGGSKTQVAIAEVSGRVIAAATGEASNATTRGVAAALGSIDAAIARAFVDAGRSTADIRAVVAGIAGADRPRVKTALSRALTSRFPSVPVRVVSDAELVLAAGTPAGIGVALVSGTGSIALGRDSTGATVRAGGWGPLIDDEGSAHGVGKLGLRAVLRARDGRLPTTTLSDAVMSELGITTPEHIIDLVGLRSNRRLDVPAIARVVASCAAAGDGVAGEIMAQAAEELAGLVIAVESRLVGRRPFALALSGGLIANADGLRSMVVARLRAAGTEFDPIETVHDPSLGAVRLALELG